MGVYIDGQGVDGLGQGESFLLVLLGLDKGKAPLPNSVWEEELEWDSNSPPLPPFLASTGVDPAT